MSRPTTRALPDRPDPDHLRTQAKRLRDGIAAADPDATGLLAGFDPPPAPEITLARAQRVLARSYGFGSWSALIHHVDERRRLTRDMLPTSDSDGPTDAFLRAACLSYTAPFDPDRATRMLDEDPTAATASVATLAVAGRADELAAVLRSDPGAVTAETGPYAWPPLLYACYSRIPQADASATVRLLLAAGADPNAGFLWQGMPSPFTAVTGVLGGGERDESPHPDAVALVGLLLDAGADPNDNQALYNRMFRPDDSHLPPLLAAGLGRAHPSPWRDRLGEAYPSPEQMIGEHLRSAAASGFGDRVRLLLAHGVDPDTVGYHPIHRGRTPYQLAMMQGHLEIAALLVEAGADTAGVDRLDRLLGALLAGAATAEPDTDLRTELVRARPDAVRIAVAQHGTAAVERLLAAGFGIDDTGDDGVTALHQAAWDGDADACRRLLDLGANPELRDRSHDGTPADWAAYAGHPELAAELTPP